MPRYDRSMKGSAAAFAASVLWAGTAVAGPPERATGPDGVRTCPRLGPGFIEIPGTSTCIRIGGRVVAEAGTGRSAGVSRDRIAGFGTQGSVTLDARTDTELGPFRAVWRIRASPNGDLR